MRLTQIGQRDEQKTWQRTVTNCTFWGKHTHCSCLSHAKQTLGTPIPSLKYAATEPSKPLVWHLAYIQISLCHLSPQHSAHISRSAVDALACRTPRDQKPNNLRLTQTSFFFIFFLISPFFLPSLALCQTKRSYVTRYWSLHVLGHIFIQHALGDYSAGPPAVEESGRGLQATWDSVCVHYRTGETV